MYPCAEEALLELEIAGRLNPGPWVKHSENVGLAAKYIAHCIPGLDETKAYVLGLLHDIGRRAGVVSTPRHVLEGWRYCMEKHWDEAARVCMTHSYVFMEDSFSSGPRTEEEAKIQNFLRSCGEADDYDRLIQMCDALATDYGFVILEKRFVDVVRRHGIHEDYIRGWEVTFRTKENFESRMGCSVYDVLPEIGRTTLLSPKPWMLPEKGERA